MTVTLVVGMQYYHSACIFLTLSESPSHNMSDYEMARSRRVKEVGYPDLSHRFQTELTG